ncbi:MAG: GntR family transcriptional regulator [Acidimicrobiaceae bacterium]|nr:GntR family transcriptional regulator [Acidimicrobiaceae bacterium]
MYTSIVQVRTVRYHEIANTLRRRIEAREVSAGRVMPSESELSAEFSVSRVTVRRALEILREEGLVISRQGFGWVISSDQVTQTLGRLGTIEEQMLANGMTSERRIVEFGFERATRKVAKVLNCDQVLRVKRVNTANGDPFAVVTVWCPFELGQHLSRKEVEKSAFYELLNVPIGGATQTIGADAVSKTDAALLEIRVGSPVLHCERITRDISGNAVLLSHHVFPAHRTNFVVELPSAGRSIAPNGLRLVE